MGCRLTLAAVLLAFVCMNSSCADEQPFVVVGYMPGYHINSITDEQLQSITDLVYFGLSLPEDGRLRGTDLSPEVGARLAKIKRSTSCRLLVTVGGWGQSDGFAAVAADREKRKQLVATLLEFCRTWSFSGVDYDWEFPRTVDERVAYTSLISETKNAFAEDGYLVTIAQAGSQIIPGEIYQAVDRVHLMSYDNGFPQATMEKAKKDVARLIRKGCPPAKIALGLPFYGRSKENTTRSYQDLVRPEDFDPASDNIDGYAFNGQETIRRKVRFAMRKKLAGVMIWELSMDEKGPKKSLLEQIVSVSQTPSSGTQDSGTQNSGESP